MILWSNFFTLKKSIPTRQNTHTKGNGMAIIYDDDDYQINVFWKKKIVIEEERNWILDNLVVNIRK